MATARPILIISNNPSQRDVLRKSLTTTQAFTITVANSLSQADTLLQTEGARFHAVILDLELPDGDGSTYCAKLRLQGHTMPIILVAGSCAEADVVRGLDAGANDCVSQPLRLNELLARLQAQLRIFDNSEHAVFNIGQYEFWPAAKLLMDAKNRRLRLTNKETAILKFLYRAGDRSVRRTELLDQVWGYNSGVTTHTLETHIYRLRQKIEVDRTDCRLLVTELNGYRLCAAGIGEMAVNTAPA